MDGAGGKIDRSGKLSWARRPIIEGTKKSLTLSNFSVKEGRRPDSRTVHRGENKDKQFKHTERTSIKCDFGLGVGARNSGDWESQLQEIYLGLKKAAGRDSSVSKAEHGKVFGSTRPRLVSL